MRGKTAGLLFSLSGCTVPSMRPPHECGGKPAAALEAVVEERVLQ